MLAKNNKAIFLFSSCNIDTTLVSKHRATIRINLFARSPVYFRLSRGAFILEGIVGFDIDNSSSRKSITPQDYKCSNQRSDIDAPTDLYCVYTTEWNSFKNTYLVATGVELTKEQVILARENALKDKAINQKGMVLGYKKLAELYVL